MKYQIIGWDDTGMAVEWSKYYDSIPEANRAYISYIEGTSVDDPLEFTIEYIDEE
jgi:hypothetical protein